MTSLQRIQSTPMAPYVGLMEKMSNQDKVAVATFLVAMVPNVNVVEEKPDKANAVLIREKYGSEALAKSREADAASNSF